MKKIFVTGMIAMMLSACDSSQTSFQFDEMTYSPSETVFKLFAPADAQCLVVVGDDTLQMKQMADTLWIATAKGDHKGQTYQFLVDGQASPGVFAKAVSVNGEKGVVVDLRDSDPEGWTNDKPVRRLPQDIVVYEMHHRDFSINQPLAQHPGKFLALTESWAIEHLKQLGINAIHILPSYDYGSVDETRLNEPQYNWGYDPVNYNVPEGGYSTDPYDPLCRIREFKQMVQALHQAGIAVILDVVYNHTYDIDHSNFQRTYPDYYYRGDSNGSGCGNETASEKPMMRQFMIESVKYWINEYHIDGFRFDLMGCHDIETMNAIRQAVDEIDPNIFIYGEGWSAGACALPNELLGMKANIPQMPRIAAFSDDMRDALRGPFSDDTVEGWLGRSAVSDCEADMNLLKESLKAGIAGMIAHPQVDYSKVNYSSAPYALEPTQMMAYVSCHDDMCLVDRLKASISGITEEELIRLDLLAQTAVFTSQGVPFMLSGEELLRTKQGVHNSFESPDSINRLDWQNKERYPQVFDYYKNLIALRKAHPAFHLGTADLVRQHLEFLTVENDFVVAYRLKDHAGSDEWQDIIVILNADKSPVTVDIPKGRYSVVCCDGKIDEQGLGEVTGSKVQVSPQSALIIHN
jgi:pullulanase